MSTPGPGLPLRRFTVSEVHRMRDTGILAARTELLEGVLVDMPRPSPREQEIIDRLAGVLAQQLETHVAPRQPIHPDAYAVFDPTIMVHRWETLPVTEDYRLHRFSTADYRRMADLGVVRLEDSELLDGVVLETTRRRREDAARVASLLRERAGACHLGVWTLLPLGPYSFVRLDVTLSRPESTLAPSGALGREVALVIDIGDDVDVVRCVRWPVYGRWGIEQTWLVDVQGAEIHVASDLAANRYATTRTHQPGESIPLPSTGEIIPVATLVGRS